MTEATERRPADLGSRGGPLREALRRLADVEPGDLPVLTIYLDVRPEATGERPELREGLVVLKDRLREIERTFGPRGPELDSFRADADRVERFLADEARRDAQGLAIFACAGRGLFETVESGAPFQNQVEVDAAPDLFQLARLLDDQETAVVAVVDTNTVRLFVHRTGFVDEVSGPDDATKHYRKRSMGALNQARYQRHIEKHRADFAAEAAGAIERLVDLEGATRVIIAGDEVAIPLLRQALSARVTALLIGTVPRIHIRAPRDDVTEEVAPILAAAEADEARSVADRLVAAVRADGLGVARFDPTRRAAAEGRVDVLVVAAEREALPEESRAELVRLATTTGAAVEVVAGHEGLARLGGVGALLRYRTDR